MMSNFYVFFGSNAEKNHQNTKKDGFCIFDVFHINYWIDLANTFHTMFKFLWIKWEKTEKNQKAVVLEKCFYSNNL